MSSVHPFTVDQYINPLVPSGLSSSSFFKCEKYSCLMSRAGCIKRQELAAKTDIPGAYAKPSVGALRHSYCVNCKQGKEIRSMKQVVDPSVTSLADKLLKSVNPSKTEPAPVKAKTKRCNTCKQILPAANFGKMTSTTDGLARQCRKCKAEYDKRRRSSGAIHAKKTSHIVELDFSAYPHVLKNIHKLAADELRTVDMQIMFYLLHNIPIKED